MSSESKQKESEAAPEGGKKSGLKLAIIGVVAVLVLGGGGAGAYFFLGKKASNSEGEGGSAHAAEGSSEEGHSADRKGPVADRDMVGKVVTLNPFIVNLNEPSATRYLKVAIDLEVTNDQTAAEMEKRLPQVRDICVTVLSSKSVSSVLGADGKFNLKEELMFAINNVLTSGQVIRVYFTQFVVQ